MPRVRKGAARTKARRKLLRAARGYWGTKHRHKQQAKVALIRAGQFAYRDRRNRKREFRKLWITRITAACRMRGTRYSRFMNGLQRAGVLLNRKMLSQLAIDDPKTFDTLVKLAEKHTTTSAGTRHAAVAGAAG
jgi:large subunit ribosomal protein L20